MTKAALELLGLPGGAMRAPLLAATEAERHRLAIDLTAGGVKLPGIAPGRDRRVSHPHPDLAPPGRLRATACASSRSAGSARSAGT